jgi:hypothetical protein
MQQSNQSKPDPGAAQQPRIWTTAKDASLISLHGGGHTYAVIAGKLGITTNAAAGRIATLIRLGALKARNGKWTKVADHPEWFIPTQGNRGADGC